MRSRLLKGFTAGDRIVVMLGDNIFEHSIQQAISDFQGQQMGARVLLKRVYDPKRYGVAVLDRKNQIVEIEEKPIQPKSDYAVVGVYFYDASVFDIIRTIEPSDRGEYEITSVNNAYIDQGKLEYSLVEGKWVDAGTFNSLAEAHKILLERKNIL